MKRIEKTELTISKILEASLEEFGAKGYAGGKNENRPTYRNSVYTHAKR